MKQHVFTVGLMSLTCEL